MKKIASILIAAMLPLLLQAQLVVNSNYLVMAGGTQSSPSYLVLNDSASTGITYNGGWIISENEFNMVQWNIRQSTGTFLVPFGYSTAQYLPLTVNIGSTPGVGPGNIKFSTYHTGALNSSTSPSDVNNITPFFLPGNPSNNDNSYNIVDRFYIVDANSGYSAKPAPDNIAFSYISGTGNTEVGVPNAITESNLMAQRYNSGTNTWNSWYGYGCTDAVASNTGTVQTGPLSSNDFYRSWSLWDNGMSLPISMSASSNPCSGGTATASVLGGASPYTYLWSDASSQTTANAGGLSTGSYTITVHDSHGCSSTASVNITAPAVLTISTTQTNIVCYGQNDGSATANPAGGTSPYTYSWSVGGTNALKSNLSAGTYTVTVSDNNGCNATAAVTIIQPTMFAYVSAGVVSNASCYNISNGSVTVNPVGGNPPYTYAWNNASTTVSGNQTATGLSAGTYTITVQDNCGVTKTSTATINQPAPLRDSISAVTNITCNGGNGGSASTGVKGGTYPYLYTWTPGGSTLAMVTGLTAGSFTVVVTDQHGCSTTNANRIATITQPAAIRDSVAGISYPLCNGEKGSITVGVKGGLAPYIYSWSPAVSTTSTATSVAAGTYTITIKDAHRCTSQLVVAMTQPGAIRDSMVAAAKVNVSCNGANNGSATVGVKYGTSPYTYHWAPNVSSTATANGLSAGTYSVSVTDKNGCLSAITGVMITQPMILRDSVSILGNVGCNGGSGGEISVGTRGGAAPYTYAWSNGKSTYMLSGLSAGIYTVTVTDHGGCSNTLSVTVSQPAQIISAINDSCLGYGQAKVTLSVSGGVAPYTYKWSNGKTTTTMTVTNGTYTVTVKDAHGCSETNSVTSNCPNTPGAPPRDKPQQQNPPGCCPALRDVNLYPNPNTGQFTITGLDQGMIIYLFDYTGRRISTFTASDITMQLNIANQPNGIYLIRISSKDGQVVAQKKIVKTQ